MYQRKAALQSHAKVRAWRRRAFKCASVLSRPISSHSHARNPQSLRFLSDFFFQLRGDKALAETRALRAETDATKARAMMAVATATQNEQLEGAAAAVAAAKGAAEALEVALALSEAARTSAEQNNALIAETVPALSTRYETMVGSLAKSEAQVAIVLQRSTELEVREAVTSTPRTRERTHTPLPSHQRPPSRRPQLVPATTLPLQRLLTSKNEEAEALRGAAVFAEERQAAALVSLRGCEDALAAANARNAAYETSERELQKAVEALTVETETGGQEKAICEAEIATLRDELGRRPPIDVIRASPPSALSRRRDSESTSPSIFLTSAPPPTTPHFLFRQASSTSRIYCSVTCRPPRPWGSSCRGRTRTSRGRSQWGSRRRAANEA